jgi:outer membrane receptor for ferrienterochelin and colicin
MLDTSPEHLFLTGNVFLNKESVELNSEAINEKVFSAEIGYGFRSEKFNANVNVYRTSWLDKSLTARVQDPDNTGEFLEANLPGLDALHQGLEVDFAYKMSDNFTLTGMASLGDWRWKSDVTAEIFDQSGASIKSRS